MVRTSLAQEAAVQAVYKALSTREVERAEMHKTEFRII